MDPIMLDAILVLGGGLVGVVGNGIYSRKNKKDDTQSALIGELREMVDAEREARVAETAALRKEIEALREAIGTLRKREVAWFSFTNQLNREIVKHRGEPLDLPPELRD